MLFKFVAAGLAYTAAFAAAYTAPAHTGEPSGNDIYTPGLEEAVPAGKPYTITWKPTTEGPITLVFLKGPASNAVAQYAIAEGIANTGAYVWTPSADLTPAKTGYGILLVDDATGKYQYSTQFGIAAAADYSGSESTSAATAVTKTSATGLATPTVYLSSSSVSPVTTSAAATPTAYYGGDDSDDSDDNEEEDDTETSTTSALPLTTPAPKTYTAVATVKPASASASALPTLHTTTSNSTIKPTAIPKPATGAASRTLAASFGGLVFAAGVAVLAL